MTEKVVHWTSQAVSSGPLSLVKSRKFIVLIVEWFLVILAKKLGVDLGPVELAAMSVPAAAVIAGIAYEDGKSKEKKNGEVQEEAGSS